jgi:glycosyltransferase involved in cell wall biosynthesis
LRWTRHHARAINRPVDSSPHGRARPRTAHPKRVIYISYDGLGDALGASQVLPYVEGLAERGHEFELLSFEKPGNRLAFREPIAPGVRWTALRYHKTPTVPATAFDMSQGALASVLAALATRADFVHTRSYVAATLALPLVIAGRRPLLFDTRGLWPEERVDGNLWSREGKIYRSATRVEQSLFARADAITVLTNNVKDYLRQEYGHRAQIRSPITVIPTCADLDLFHPDGAKDEEVAPLVEGSRTLAYVGSIGTWYMAEEMARFYLAWRAAVAPSSARFLVVTRDDPSPMRSVLAAHGVETELVHRSAKRERVAKLLRCSEAALSFVRESLSKRASAPTKIGEYLGCGIPVIGTAIGDARLVLAEPGAGLLIERFDDETLAESAKQLAAFAASRDRVKLTRAAAERWFSLERAIDAYDELYTQMPRWHGQRWTREDRGWP